MPGFFEALENFKPTDRKKPTVEIQGKIFEVEIQLFKDIERNGKEQYEIKDGKIALKPRRNFKKTYERLVKSDKGHSFIDADPYWPSKIVTGGYSWQKETE